MHVRFFDRHPIGLEVKCSVGSREDLVLLHDLSTTGCMIEIRQTSFTVGDEVALHLDGAGRVRGHIVWKINGNAGIEFAIAIPDALITQLGFMAKGSDFHACPPKDRYGTPLTQRPESGASRDEHQEPRGRNGRVTGSRLIVKRPVRKPVRLEASFRTKSGRQNTWMQNISGDGCCIDTNGRRLKVGETISIHLGPYEARNAYVCWVSEGRAGILFEKAIYPPTLDHLTEVLGKSYQDQGEG